MNKFAKMSVVGVAALSMGWTVVTYAAAGDSIKEAQKQSIIDAQKSGTGKTYRDPNSRVNVIKTPSDQGRSIQHGSVVGKVRKTHDTVRQPGPR